MARIGHEILRLEEASSTNTLLMQEPAYLERDGLVVLVRHQTGGRGRMGRQWASLPGQQLQFSAVLHPEFPPADFPLVALLAGLAVAESIRDELGLAPRLKWPNDVLVGGRKVCGILVESTSGTGNRPRLVVGIGINCIGRAADFPAELRGRLTTLEQQGGGAPDTERLLQAVLERLQVQRERLTAGDKAGLLREWRRFGLLGGALRVRLPTSEGELQGVPEGLTDEGYLQVRMPDGTLRVHVSGELEWNLYGAGAAPD